jgi:hypothetical protein
MSKKYKNLKCAYCCVNEATTKDHVIARGFILTEHRSNLPTAPACLKCNHKKSQLEHYLIGVVGLGGRHSESTKTISELVEKNLSKNLKLKRNLANGISQFIYSQDNKIWQVGMKVPIDIDRVELLFEFTMKGLSWSKWGTYLPEQTNFIRASYMNSVGIKLFEGLLSLRGKRLSLNLGQGAFSCEAVQSDSNPELTVWKMSLYGAEVTGDPRDVNRRSSFVYGISLPKSFGVSADIQAMFQ